jgi:hypothetical protein
MAIASATEMVSKIALPSRIPGKQQDPLHWAVVVNFDEITLTLMHGAIPVASYPCKTSDVWHKTADRIRSMAHEICGWVEWACRLQDELGVEVRLKEIQKEMGF